MKKLTLIVLMMAVAFCGNAKQKKHKKKRKSTTGITSVSIHHTVCFGRCPDYIVEINSDGIATYTAIRFNEDTGIFTKNIGKDKAAEVIGMFSSYRVDTCKDTYENKIPDLAGMIIQVQYTSGTTKTIHNARFGPAFLKELSEAVDAAGKKTDNSWKKSGMPKLD